MAMSCPFRTDWAFNRTDGRIIAAGSSLNSASVSSFALARYDPNGILDTSFGVSGKVITAFPAGSSDAVQVIVQPDGRAVAVGGAGGSFALARYTKDDP